MSEIPGQIAPEYSSLQVTDGWYPGTHDVQVNVPRRDLTLNIDTNLASKALERIARSLVRRGEDTAEAREGLTE